MILQSQERATAYSTLSFLQFVLTLSLIFTFVLGAHLPIAGPLIAGLISGVVATLLGLALVWRSIELSIDRRSLREAISYSLPLLPHACAVGIYGVADRI